MLAACKDAMANSFKHIQNTLIQTHTQKKKKHTHTYTQYKYNISLVASNFSSTVNLTGPEEKDNVSNLDTISNTKLI